MPARDALDALAQGGPAGSVKGILKRIAAQTSHATQGTRSTHAHGLTDFAGNAVVPNGAMCVETATAVDNPATGLLTGRVHVVTFDNTNVTVRAEVSSQTFDLYVW